MEAPKDFDAKQAHDEAVRDGRIKLEMVTHQCTFCNQEHKCLQWVPDKLPWAIPVCTDCFTKLNETFGKIGGGLCWG